METLVRTLSDFCNSGHEIILVSSGAVAAGISKLGLTSRPTETERKMALAAVGQAELMQVYERLFAAYGHTVGQILMTKDVIDNPTRRAAAESTFRELLGYGCIPIVNENDSVSSEEIKFGGNDTLSAYVALVCSANILINLSDVDGLYKLRPEKKSRREAHQPGRYNRRFYHSLRRRRRLGARYRRYDNQIKAAQIATSAGIPMLIVNGKNPDVLYEISDGKHIGTYFAREA